MYNTEKYIAECLDSILAQTFDDYEVIVVDDCSTDKSCAIVESYSTKFKEKLRVTHLETNSGYGGIPRNIGTKVSHGEYVFYLDSDDMITKTALEELYKVAKSFDADVVDCQKYFRSNTSGIISDKTSELISYIPKDILVDRPTLISDNLAERANKVFRVHFISNLWTKLIKRNFLIENDLTMMDAAGQDLLMTCCLVCSNSRYVVVPNVVNFYRIHEDSVFHSGINDPIKITKKWARSLVRGFNHFNAFLCSQNFFVEHPESRYIALERIVKEFSGYLLKVYAQIPAYQINKLVSDEFNRVEDISELSAFLFGRMSIFNVNLIQHQNLIRQQQQQIQQLQSQLQQLQQNANSFRLNTEDIYKL